MSDLTAVPASFSAGSTLALSLTLPNYPGPTWTATLYLNGKAVLTKAGIATGEVHRFTLSAVETAALNPGTYKWLLRAAVSDQSTVVDVAAGTLVVTPNPATAAAGDGQTFEEKALALVESALLGRLPSGMETFQIAGRAVSQIPIAELLKVRAQLRQAVALQRGSTTLGRRILGGFTKVGVDH